MNPADHLRELMARHGLKQKDLNPIPQPCISRYLTNDRPISWHHAVLLAKRFDQSVEMFLEPLPKSAGVKISRKT
jgi:plasmid maintenance system antidote protein VapI